VKNVLILFGRNQFHSVEIKASVKTQKVCSLMSTSQSAQVF